MDYKKLLEKYVMHIDNIEGSDYIRFGTVSQSNAKFTPEEKAELERIANELNA